MRWRSSFSSLGKKASVSVNIVLSIFLAVAHTGEARGAKLEIRMGSKVDFYDGSAKDIKIGKKVRCSGYEDVSKKGKIVGISCDVHGMRFNTNDGCDPADGTGFALLIIEEAGTTLATVSNHCNGMTIQ